MSNDEEIKRHLGLSIGCPNVLGGSHGAFSVEDGKFICDCKKDFTEEAKEAAAFLIASLQKDE